MILPEMMRGSERKLTRDLPHHQRWSIVHNVACRADCLARAREIQSAGKILSELREDEAPFISAAPHAMDNRRSDERGA
jgi:hypothetical protein